MDEDERWRASAPLDRPYFERGQIRDRFMRLHGFQLFQTPVEFFQRRDGLCQRTIIYDDDDDTNDCSAPDFSVRVLPAAVVIILLKIGTLA